MTIWKFRERSCGVSMCFMRIYIHIDVSASRERGGGEIVAG